jgi:hypothetical protein
MQAICCFVLQDMFYNMLPRRRAFKPGPEEHNLLLDVVQRSAGRFCCNPLHFVTWQHSSPRGLDLLRHPLTCCCHLAGAIVAAFHIQACAGAAQASFLELHTEHDTAKPVPVEEWLIVLLITSSTVRHEQDAALQQQNTKALC